MRPETSTYQLELPPEYKIHPTFNARRLKLFDDDDPALFPNRDTLHARISLNNMSIISLEIMESQNIFIQSTYGKFYKQVLPLLYRAKR
jgi:hypothetical protein